MLGRHIQCDDDAFAAHFQAGQVLAIAVAERGAHAAAGAGGFLCPQALEFRLLCFDVALEFVEAGDFRQRFGVQRLQRVLLIAELIVERGQGDTRLVEAALPVFEGLQEFRQIFFAFQHLIVEHAQLGQLIPVHFLNRFFGSVIDDQKNQHHGAEAARHDVEEAERKNAKPAPGHPAPGFPSTWCRRYARCRRPAAARR